MQNTVLDNYRQEQGAFFEIDRLQNVIRHAPRHVHGYTEIVCLLEGEGTLEVEWKNNRMKKNQMFYILPNQLHRMTLENADGFIVRFNEYFLPPMFMRSSPMIYECELNEEIIALICRLYKESLQMNAYRDQLLSSYLHILFLQLSRQFNCSGFQTVSDAGYRLAERFIKLVDEHYKEYKRVSEYAELMRVTPSYLNENIKRMTGNTAGYHIRQRIIIEAKRHAILSGHSMKEIACNLGFSDIAYFSKFFKQATGNNFSSFKRAQTAQALIPETVGYSPMIRSYRPAN